MSKLARLLLLMLCGLCNIKSFAQQPRKCVVGCLTASVHVTEQPSGTVDGKNNSFALSKIPLDDWSIQLFINGIEVRNRTDFRVSGRTITIFDGANLRAGDLLQVSYNVPLPPVTAAVSPQTSSSGRTRAIVQEALLESLRREAPTPSSAMGAKDATPDRSKNDPPSKGTVDLRSLSMLSRSINTPRRADKTKTKHDEHELEGVEGFGDLPVMNTYGAILGIANADTTGLTGAASPSRSIGSSASFRSITMLGRRLDSSSEPEGHTGAGK